MKVLALFLLVVGVIAAGANVVPEFLEEDNYVEDYEMITEDDIDWESLRPAIEEWALSGDVSESEDDDDDDVTDIDQPRYELQGCSGGRCDLCFRLWKIKGCIYAELAGNRIKFSIQIRGKTLYSEVIKARNYTIRISKRRLPRYLSKFIKGDININVTKINPRAKRFCVQVVIEVTRIGTLRWPSRPKCFRM